MSYPTIKSLLVLLALLVAGGLFLNKLYHLLWINLRRGQPSHVFNRWDERIKAVVVYVGGQLRLFRFLKPGTAHFFIFWGFLILAPTIVQAIVEGLTAFTGYQIVLPFLNWGPVALLQDLFAVFVIGAVAYDLYVRQVVNPDRYKGSHKSRGRDCAAVHSHHHAQPAGHQRRTHQPRCGSGCGLATLLHAGRTVFLPACSERGQIVVEETATGSIWVWCWFS